MKKCLFITIGLVMMLTSCASLTGLKKEKIEDGLVRYSDVVLDTVRFENPKLVPNVEKGKFNLHKGADSENINAYIENDQFYIEAAYECKSPNLLKINSIVFMSGDERLTFKKTRLLPEDLNVADYHYEALVNPYFSYSSVDNYSYEEFKMVLTTEEVEQLSSLLEAGDLKIAFVGERGRTDLFKVNKKIVVALRSVISRYNYILFGEPEEELLETDLALEEETDEEYTDEGEDFLLEEDIDGEDTLDTTSLEGDSFMLEPETTEEEAPAEETEGEEFTDIL